MKFFDSAAFLKTLPILIVLGLFLLLSYPAQVFLQGDSKTQDSKVSTSSAQEATPSSEVKIDKGNSSVKVDVKNSTNVQGETSTNPENKGTCTVTKNGVTETVPADSVKIDEQSKGDLSIQVKCDNSYNSSTSNSTNKSSVKNDIRINTSTSGN